MCGTNRGLNHILKVNIDTVFCISISIVIFFLLYRFQIPNENKFSPQNSRPDFIQQFHTDIHEKINTPSGNLSQITSLAQAGYLPM